MLVIYNFSAVLPIVQKEWSLTNSQAGWIYSSYQIGYILAVVFLASLTDYISPKYIYIATALWAGISGLFFSFFAEGFVSALILRTLTGMGLAGTYMPGLRMVSERFSHHERGKAVGIYVAAFSLGGSISIFLTGFLCPLLSWRGAMFITSIGPIAGGMIALFRLGEIVHHKSAEERSISFSEILRNRPAVMMILGYVGHMWEMFGMRGWMVTFLTASLLSSNVGFSKAVSLSAFFSGFIHLAGAASNALGGVLSDRFGRTRTILVVMLGSSLMSMIFGWTRPWPFWIVLGFSLLYGLMVTAESSVLSTGITELAPSGGLGRTMAVQSLLGFGAASLSPIAFGFVLDASNPGDALARYGFFPNWGWAFMILAPGGLLGTLFVWRVKKEV